MLSRWDLPVDSRSPCILKRRRLYAEIEMIGFDELKGYRDQIGSEGPLGVPCAFFRNAVCQSSSPQTDFGIREVKVLANLDGGVVPIR